MAVLKKRMLERQRSETEEDMKARQEREERDKMKAGANATSSGPSSVLRKPDWLT
jgi:ribose 1,5-bisphosphokinase PhnN